jgi:dolichol-phosphate mannosyltransferase
VRIARAGGADSLGGLVVSDAIVMPVYNEARTLTSVLDEVRKHFTGTVVVVDDGSTDDTPAILAAREDIHVETIRGNCGYGCALMQGFSTATAMGVERLVTMDCDGQHEPAHIPEFLEALGRGYDVVSGSRYLPESRFVGIAPMERRRVNEIVTGEINAVTGWGLTDAFCGFKAYRADVLEAMELSEPGYAMPLELWASAYRLGLRVLEIPVERIYSDYDRTFGTDLDDPEKRLAYYLSVWRAALETR